MALTESTMISLGTQAPDFTLPEPLTNKNISLHDVAGEKATVIMFICNHCPYVIHVNDELVRLGNDYLSSGIGFVAISSNDVINYPQDGPELMALQAKELSYPFPYLYDESQEVAKSYDAACTPDLYVFDGNLKLAYRGRLDGSRPNAGIPVTGVELRNALDAILAGNVVGSTQYPSAGCGIKWK